MNHSDYLMVRAWLAGIEDYADLAGLDAIGQDNASILMFLSCMEHNIIQIKAVLNSDYHSAACPNSDRGKQ